MPPVTQRPDMSGYDVPEDLDGVLPWSWAEARLVGSRNFWLTTVAADGRPHSLPVWGVWLPDHDRFWFSCAPSARKVRNLAANPQVVVAPSDSVEVVSLEGRAEPSTDALGGAALDAYWEKYGAEMHLTREGVDAFLLDNAAFDVMPERAFGIIERADDFSRRATRWVWPG